MSDLEAPRAHTNAAAPISSVAVGKLRALRGGQAAITGTDGIIDAFAEVFASIAASKPVVTGDQVDKSETPVVSDDRRPTDHHVPVQSNDRVTEARRPSEDQSDGAADGRKQETEAVAAEPATERIESEAGEDVAVAALSEPQQEVAQETELVAAPVEQPTEQVEEIETPEWIAQEVVDDHDSQRQRRDRRQDKVVDPVESNQDGRVKARHNEQAIQPNRPQVDSGEAEPNPLVNTATEADAQDSSRHQNGRHHGPSQSLDDQLKPYSQSERPRAAQQPAEVQPAPETTSSDQGRSASTRPSATPTAESTVNNIHNVASNVTRSNVQSNGQASSQGASRTHAVEGPSSVRDDTRVAPKSSKAKNHAAETVSRVKLIQRVSKAFQHLGPEGGVVRLRLAPAEMGSVRVEMKIHQRKVQARVVADSEAASSALREHLPELRQRLESQGMEIERLDIETENGEWQFDGQRNGRDGHPQGDRQQPWSDPQPHTGRSDSSSNEPAGRPNVSHTVAHTPISGVDVQL